MYRPFLNAPTGFDCGWGVDHTAIQQIRYYFNNTNGSGRQTGRLGLIYVYQPGSGGRTFTYAYRSNTSFAHSESNRVASVAGGSFMRTIAH